MDSNAPQLTLEAIKRWYRRFRYDHEYRDENGSFTVPISAFCDYAGVGRQNLYAMMRGQQGFSEEAARRLSQAIYDVQQGLRFTRRNRKYEIIGEFAPLPRWERSPLHRLPRWLEEAS
jgi:hypothetical protein